MTSCRNMDNSCNNLKFEFNLQQPLGFSILLDNQYFSLYNYCIFELGWVQKSKTVTQSNLQKCNCVGAGLRVRCNLLTPLVFFLVLPLNKTLSSPLLSSNHSTLQPPLKKKKKKSQQITMSQFPSYFELISWASIYQHIH